MFMKVGSLTINSSFPSNKKSMPSICIVSDSTALFPNPVFKGRSQVQLLTAEWQGPQPNPERLKAGDLPESLKDAEAPVLAIPSQMEFEGLFRALGAKYDGVLAILHSSKFSPASANAQEAAQALNGNVPVRVIDSHTASLGLGLMVQAAASAAEGGMQLNDLDLYARSLIPKIYGMLCIPGLTYLQRAGGVNPSQALVGEYLDIMQVFTLDNGELVPTQKARNARHLVDILVEFLSEFFNLEHIAIMQGAPAFEQETRGLRERLNEERPGIPISEQIINAPFASLVGPHSLGVYALAK
jgi:DegV family protein with EDD domain